MGQAAETEVLDPPAGAADDQSQDQANGKQPAANDQAGDAPAGEQDEVVVTIGEESPPSEEEEEGRAPEWVRDLRKTNREKDRKIRELEQRLNTGANGQQTAVVIGEKPTLEHCDFDTEKFERDLEAWHERKRRADEDKRKSEDEARAAQDAWNAKLAAYGTGKAALKVKDFEDAEDVAKEAFNVTQQGIIVSGAENPALVIYALGKNAKRAKELALITDPVKFAFAVAKLETQLKVTPRKAAPLPEKTVRGSAPMSGTVDSQLEKLREEATRTGDFSKVHQYRQQQRAKQK